MSGMVLAVTPPFDFGHTLRFLGGFTPGQGEQNTAGELRKATRLNGQTVGFVIREAGTDLTCELFPERPLRSEEVEALTARLRFFLGLDEDLSAFMARASEDVAFRVVLRALNGFHQPRFLTPFEAACWAILSQRLPMPQARTLKRELSLRCGGGWEGLPAFPEPADVASLSPAEHAATIPNDRKARALAGLAQAFAAVSPAELASRPTAELREWLLAL
jgi:DNA-3-methyladenine glycosylase II